MLVGGASQRVRTVTFVSCVAVVGLAAMALAQRPSPIDAALRDLASQDVSTRERGLATLLAQSGVDVQGANATRVRVFNLLQRHPEEGERISTTLISALEQTGGRILVFGLCHLLGVGLPRYRRGRLDLPWRRDRVDLHRRSRAANLLSWADQR